MDADKNEALLSSNTKVTVGFVAMFVSMLITGVVSVEVSSARTEVEVKNAIQRLDFRREEHIMLSAEVREFKDDLNRRLGRMEGILEEMQRSRK